MLTYFAIFTKNAIVFGRYTWPYRLGVRTAGFQSVNPGSIPGRVTKLGSQNFVTLSEQTALLASGNRKTELVEIQ